MKPNTAHYDNDFLKRIDRLEVETTRNSPYVEIIQTHSNGSDEVVARMTLDRLEEVRDLHFMLSRIIAGAEGR